MNNTTSLRVLAAMFVCGAVATRAFPEDKKIALKNAPVAVQKTIADQLKGGTLRELVLEVENGKSTYEADLAIDGHVRTLAIDAKGTLLETESAVELNAIPAAAREGLLREAAKGSISEVEEVTKDGAVFYEAMVKEKGGKAREVVVDASGKAVPVKK